MLMVRTLVVDLVEVNGHFFLSWSDIYLQPQFQCQTFERTHNCLSLHQLLMINLPINISSKNSKQPQENSSICVVSRLVKSIGVEEVLYLQFIRFIKLWPGKVGTQKNESIADKRMAHSKSSCREGVGTLCINWHIVSLKESPFGLQ